MGKDSGKEEHTVYQAFQRKPRYFGVEPFWMIVVVGLSGMFFFVLPIYVSPFVITVVAYSLMKFVAFYTADDGQAMDVLRGSAFQPRILFSGATPDEEGKIEPDASVPSRE